MHNTSLYRTTPNSGPVTLRTLRIERDGIVVLLHGEEYLLEFCASYTFTADESGYVTTVEIQRDEVTK